MCFLEAYLISLKKDTFRPLGETRKYCLASKTSMGVDHGTIGNIMPQMTGPFGFVFQKVVGFSVLPIKKKTGRRQQMTADDGACHVFCSRADESKPRRMKEDDGTADDNG